MRVSFGLVVHARVLRSSNHSERSLVKVKLHKYRLVTHWLCSSSADHWFPTTSSHRLASPISAMLSPLELEKRNAAIMLRVLGS